MHRGPHAAPGPGPDDRPGALGLGCPRMGYLCSLMGAHPLWGKGLSHHCPPGREGRAGSASDAGLGDSTEHMRAWAGGWEHVPDGRAGEDTTRSSH